MPLRTPLAGRLGPGGVRGRRLPLGPSPLQVWAVEDTAAQLTWGHLPPGTVAAESDGAGVEVDHAGGAGGIVVPGLQPGRAQRIRVRWDGGEAIHPLTTLPPPPGELLARVATLSDLHLGATHWGLLRTLGEDRHPDQHPHPWRCAAAALDEARRWGAQAVVLKGDLAEHRQPDHFALVGELVDRVAELPVLVLPGNHDVDLTTDMDLPSDLGRRGAAYVDGVAHLDLPGVRLVGGNTAVPGQGPGRLGPIGDALVERASSCGGPALVLLHHHLHRHRIPTHWPPGISGAEAGPFLDRLAAANPSTVVSCGHSHRNRTRRHGPLVVSEVGSTKDWPGVWAGYAVHEGGIRQVVRRTQAPSAASWTEYSRAAVLGLWGRWSPGPLHQRCWTHRWPGDDGRRVT
jgi:3',5'-cyclic-AMP phosphodiesterase